MLPLMLTLMLPLMLVDDVTPIKKLVSPSLDYIRSGSWQVGKIIILLTETFGFSSQDKYGTVFRQMVSF